MYSMPHKHSNLGGHIVTCDANLCISSTFCFPPRYFFKREALHCLFSMVFSSLCVDFVEYVVLNLISASVLWKMHRKPNVYNRF